MPEAAIALGSNLPSPFGDLAQNLREAIERLRPIGTVTACSSFFDTTPVGILDQPRFLNAAVLLDTLRTPHDLLTELLAIERSMGRTREGVSAKGPRIIDLDLLFYDQVILTTPTLTLPHPAIAERVFVLAPLAEIAPGWPHPITGDSVVKMLARLQKDPD